MIYQLIFHGIRWDLRILVAIEHENAYSQDIYRDELPKLLASGAQLKVLITYVKRMREETDLVGRIKGNYGKPKREQKTRQVIGEFLLLLGDSEGSQARWRAYIFHPSGKLGHIKARTDLKKLTDVI